MTKIVKPDQWLAAKPPHREVYYDWTQDSFSNTWIYLGWYDGNGMDVDLWFYPKTNYTQNWVMEHRQPGREYHQSSCIDSYWLESNMREARLRAILLGLITEESCQR